jgi:hypothetical protein
MRFVTGVLILLLASSANRVLMWVSNNGRLAHNPIAAGSGLEWPQGSARSLAFSQGLVWGAQLDGEARVGGASFNGGWQAGIILPSGLADDPSDPLHRIYRARRFDAAWWKSQPRSVQEQLLRDYMEWPVQWGAPWIDTNANGIYEADTAAWISGAVADGPRMRGDEMLWFASNALDPGRMSRLYGSQPAAVELHTLLWSSTSHPLLDNVVFHEHTLINKGALPLDDMRIGFWEDADLGDAFDDFYGIDTTLHLVYAYNGLPQDGIFGVPPAAGTLWLQTPAALKTGSVARFGDGMRYGYENLPLAAFEFFVGGSSVYREGQLGSPEGAVQMLHLLAGNKWNGTTFEDPTTGNPTPFLLAGDPVRATGWFDGIVSSPGDRRALSSSAAFTLAPGDTQKVIFAALAADGGNQFLSVRTLRKAARQLHDIYRNLPFGATAPVFTSGISYPTEDTFAVGITGGPFPNGTNGVVAVLRDADGNEIQRGDMFDDGMHGDGSAGDGIHGAFLEGPAKSAGADAYVITTDAEGQKEWFVDSELALPGKAEVQLTGIRLDAPKTDGRAQPGEYLHFSLGIDNGTTQDLGEWHLFISGEATLRVDRSVQRYGTTIPAGGRLDITYDVDAPESYFGITLPDDTPPGTYVVPITLMSGKHCTWTQELTFEVDSLPGTPADGLLAHVQGLASGSLGYVITTKSALTDHDYRVSIEGDDFGEKTMHIEDVTLGTTLYRGWSVPNRYDPISQEIDGWRIVTGTAFDQPVYAQDGDRLASFSDDVDETFSAPQRSWFTVYENDILAADESWWGSAATQYDLDTVRLVFDRGNGQKALRYLRGASPNYGYTGYFDVPLRAYDISDPAQPRQLMLGFVEQAGRASCDSNYAPTSAELDREILLIFGDDYADQPPSEYQRQLSEGAPEFNLHYVLWALRDSAAPMFADGDSYLITPRVPVSNRDVYILAKPVTLVGVTSTPAQPTAASLHGVYPNPLGNGSPGAAASATVRFDTPRAGSVRLTLHDLLGRRIATIVDQHLTAGTHRVQFGAQGLQSGTYVLLLDTGGKYLTRTVTVLR